MLHLIFTWFIENLAIEKLPGGYSVSVIEARCQFYRKTQQDVSCYLQWQILYFRWKNAAKYFISLLAKNTPYAHSQNEILLLCIVYWVVHDGFLLDVYEGRKHILNWEFSSSHRWIGSETHNTKVFCSRRSVLIVGTIRQILQFWQHSGFT